MAWLTIWAMSSGVVLGFTLIFLSRSSSTYWCFVEAWAKSRIETLDNTVSGFWVGVSPFSGTVLMKCLRNPGIPLATSRRCPCRLYRYFQLADGWDKVHFLFIVRSCLMQHENLMLYSDVLLGAWFYMILRLKMLLSDHRRRMLREWMVQNIHFFFFGTLYQKIFVDVVLNNVLKNETVLSIVSHCPMELVELIF